MRILKNLSYNFIFALFILYSFKGILSNFFNPFIYWISKNVFNISYFFEKNGYGSGDNTYAYIYLFVSISISLIIAVVFLLFNKKNDVSEKQIYFLKLFLRVYLTFYILIYGFGKVFFLQFSPISEYRLIQSYGESSPMGLAWTFLQYSPEYTFFLGLTEVIGALMLLSRKYTIFGSFILLGVLANVFMMNLCYDIPVKINSFFYFLASIVLLLLNFEKIKKIFRICEEKQDFKLNLFKSSHSYKKVTIVFKLVFVLLIVSYFSLLYSHSEQTDNEDQNLSGLYSVDYSKSDLVGYEKQIEINLLWRYIFIGEKNRMVIKYVNDSTDFFTIKVDSIKNILVFEKQKSNKETKEIYNYINKGPNEFIIYNNNAKYYLKKKRKKDFGLINRGFNWVNEKPFNK